jgi:carboxymethylenebutenolidase
LKDSFGRDILRSEKAALGPVTTRPQPCCGAEEDKMGTMITYERPDGKHASGYLAQTGRAGAPGMVVIQEWWGVQDQIKGICDRFALAGYDALAPDLYAGLVVPYHDRETANREMGAINFLTAADQQVRGAAKFLALDGAKVGVTGFCMGGALTVLAAIRVPEFSTAICFYGVPPVDVADPAAIRTPLQAHFANYDDWCTPAIADAFEAKLESSGKQAEVYRYDAHHGFLNEQRFEAHNREAAELAWGRMLDFCKRHL